MDALQSLRMALAGANTSALERPPFIVDLQPTIRQLRSKVNAASQGAEPQDRVLNAINSFWSDSSVDELQAARYVSFGLTMPTSFNSQTLLSDNQRFSTFLNDEIGVGQWKSKPSWFRRVLQGLVASYFAFDPESLTATDEQRKNWILLRHYIFTHLELSKSASNPDWLNCCLEHSSLFTDSPGDDFSELILQGRNEELEHKLELLRARDTWLPRELILSQVRSVARLKDGEFSNMINLMIAAVGPHHTIQDKVLSILINRYAEQANPIVHPELKQIIVSRWDNPWLPSAAKKWPLEVTPEARALISDWLKSEFIEAFFTKLAEDGSTDRRRLDFWMRYRKQMNHVQFALGNLISDSSDPDLMTLKEKMKGLISAIRSARVNAFVMIFREVIAVEFSATGNALYLYDTRRGVPFDLSQTLTLSVDGYNSLKKSDGEKFSHHDSSNGFYSWEDIVEDVLRQQFGLLRDASTSSTKSSFSPSSQMASTVRAEDKRVEPSTYSSDISSLGMPSGDVKIPVFVQSGNGTQKTLKVVSGITSWADIIAQPYSEELLVSTCKAFGFSIVDNRTSGGALWVMIGNSHSDRNKVFRKWGFTYKPDKGWWKSRS
jgi:hypothetical protein